MKIVNQHKVINKCFILLATILIANASYAKQNCNTKAQASTPNSRFELISNGSEVKDKHTGLIWQRCSLGQTYSNNKCVGEAKKYTWQKALYAVKTLSDNSGKNYRLPNIKELSSIVEQRCDHPAINTSIFPNTPNSMFFSSTPNMKNGNVWVVQFTLGNVMPTTFTNANKRPVRAVRSE